MAYTVIWFSWPDWFNHQMLAHWVSDSQNELLSFKVSVTHLQNILGVLKKKYSHWYLKWQVRMSNYEIIEFIAMVQHLIES